MKITRLAEIGTLGIHSRHSDILRYNMHPGKKRDVDEKHGSKNARPFQVACHGTKIRHRDRGQRNRGTEGQRTEDRGTENRGTEGQRDRGQRANNKHKCLINCNLLSVPL